LLHEEWTRGNAPVLDLANIRLELPVGVEPIYGDSAVVVPHPTVLHLRAICDRLRMRRKIFVRMVRRRCVINGIELYTSVERNQSGVSWHAIIFLGGPIGLPSAAEAAGLNLNSTAFPEIVRAQLADGSTSRSMGTYKGVTPVDLSALPEPLRSLEGALLGDPIGSLDFDALRRWLVRQN
jgi:hypothetical protein